MNILIQKKFQIGTDQHFTLEWSSNPSKDQANEVEKLINGWYQEGLESKVYDSHLHFLSDIEHTKNKTYWWVDMGSSDYDKAVSGLANKMNDLNEKYSHNTQIQSLFVGKSKKRFKWQKVKLGKEFSPFENSYYYLISDSYYSSFGFELEDIGRITFTATPAVFSYFAQLPAKRRKRIKTTVENGLGLEQAADYVQEEYYKDKDLLPISLHILSKRAKFHTTGNEVYYDYPIKCFLTIEDFKFCSKGEQFVRSPSMKFELWNLVGDSSESFLLYLPNNTSLIKKIKIRFEKE